MNKKYRDLKTVESYRNEMIPEEFPDGSYGASTSQKPGKSSPWRPSMLPPVLHTKCVDFMRE
ncbi:hypothetical protein [Thermoactinomyces mirandus]|uniref:hypothetical protein n=1 Tax=Thermoactinomyces mirandus TaxID=2756294 RepID=UPI0028A8CABF|nr:hypothetical protein [Thermoactinomyces mirandus]